MEDLLVTFNAGVTATTAEIEEWGILDPATFTLETLLRQGLLGDANTTSAPSVGLFGFDLTDFLDDCATTDDCTVEDYDPYSGWAIGVNWTEGTN